MLCNEILRRLGIEFLGTLGSLPLSTNQFKMINSQITTDGVKGVKENATKEIN